MPKKLSGGVRFILGFVTFLLCILLFFSTIATIVVSDAVTIVTSQDNMKRSSPRSFSRKFPVLPCTASVPVTLPAPTV